MPNYTNSVWSETAPAHGHQSLASDVTVDVAIVGAGITGVTAARLLKDAGLKVALIDSRRVGKGETSKTTAHLTEVLDTRLHQLIADFGEDGARLAARGQRAAIERIATFVKERTIDCQFQRVSGYLYAETEDGAKIVEQEESAARRLGLSVVKVNQVPLPFPVARAVRFDDQAQFHPRVYLLALAEGIDGDGSHIFEQTHVIDVEEGGGDELCRVTT
ncbi:MAG: FAD-binding oxidoreductase, partial [Deltaproteobacteria bacterium]|nr:FAD-binding oxidoreductase [Deltaproteobacteria bacterium]